ncbi:carbohydrate ABC transporter permease [Anaerolinea thermophila]|uniref:ABC transporter permease protein n=1 Tax=Anaerolinea thermophila (strain DSM 14523 / JCM 11388 / NBRC 100420 / UNI-1) TaxID=926569 RepID=E8N3B9_ANATU|nr:carbohydrate ABC transporter permease [Anaerolinea thermophila]BAJ62933.1 putative ABC transporter permease protein [Anaerolinea thermophila UNI-1]
MSVVNPAVNARRILGSVPAYFFLTLGLLLAVLPFMLIFVTALKSPGELGNAFALPQQLHWENFLRAWTQAHFGTYFKSSLIVTLSVVGVSCLLSLLTGYAFGQLRFPFKNGLFFLFLIGLMVPTEAYIIPLYYSLRAAHLTDTYWALILPQIGMSVCFGSFWMRGFFSGIPRDLVDAARVDGCNDWQAFWHVMIPMVLPGLWTMAVLFFIWTWNDFLLALVMITKEGLRTLPLGLAMFQGKYTTDYTLTAAGATIVALPTLLFYVLFQRQFIRGVTAGAIKG